MKNVRLFYATNNKSKLHNMHYRLRDYPVDVLCPDDLHIHVDVEENGASAVENARLKAEAYYKIVKMPTIAGDSGAFIHGLSDADQPGLYLRRVKGSVLSDDEMIAYYAKLAEEANCDCYVHYFTGITMITEKGTFSMKLGEVPLKLSPIPNTNRRHKGNPLDVITLTEDGRFFNDLTDQERTELDKVGEQEFTDFILRNLL